MTDYPAWKKSEKKRKWHSTVAIFIILFLIFASLLGLVRVNKKTGQVAKYNWDNISSFAASIGDNASSVFIFQKDPKRAVVLTLGKNQKIDLGDENIVKDVSVAFGAPIENYIKLKNNTLEKVDDIKRTYENFTSWLTPIAIIINGWSGNKLDTNVSRIDALRLWWQLKSIGVNNLTINDLSSIGLEEKKSSKVLAVNTSELNREISKYLENPKIVKEDSQINIVNSSGEYNASKLAYVFINSLGGRVGTINGNTDEISRCNIVGLDSSYTVGYLAKVFDCDIKDPPQTASDSQITLTLGNEFAQKYF